MTVVYPRKLESSFGSFSARDLLSQIVRDREIHLITLNRYRYSEQRSCKDLTDLIEQLDGRAPELIKEVSRHISDEARHAMWLTELLVELGAAVNTPPGASYIDEFERLLDREYADPAGDLDNYLISVLASINVTEKRGCEYFSAHIYALKQAEQTAENIKIRETLERILPEEAGHVRWGNRWLAELGRKSAKHAEQVDHAKRKYAAIEQAAFVSGMDITLGAELRRVSNLVDIANQLPVWQRPQYLMERLPQTLLSPDLQRTRLTAVQRVWERDPQAFIERFVPMFLNGLTQSQNKSNKSQSGSRKL
jgi:hypothetical protein